MTDEHRHDEAHDEGDAPLDDQHDDDLAAAVPMAPFGDPVANARRRHGAAGAMLAAGMLGIDEAMGLRKPREEAPIVVAANDEPVDIDSDGIRVPVDEHTDVVAPPQPRHDPFAATNRRRRG